MAHLRKREAVVVGAALVPGLHPRILAWVKTGSRDWRDRWQQCCQQLGLSCMDSGIDLGGWVTVYEVWAAPMALARLTSGAFRCVEKWEHYCTKPGVYRASGSGENRHKSSMEQTQD